MSARSYPLVDARCTMPVCTDRDSGQVYRMVGQCTNCGSGPLLILVTVRHSAPTGEQCPKCGCYDVVARRLAEDDEIPDGPQ